MTDRAIPSEDWLKSSYSGSNGGECVEWAPSHAVSGHVPVRDSKNPLGPSLSFPVSEWTAFITEVKNNRFPA